MCNQNWIKQGKQWRRAYIPMTTVESRLHNFRIRFDRMTAPQKAALLGQLQAYIATQVGDPLVRACPLANQVENHFRTPSASINASWWNLLNMWKSSPLVEKIMSQLWKKKKETPNIQNGTWSDDGITFYIHWNRLVFDNVFWTWSVAGCRGE